MITVERKREIFYKNKYAVEVIYYIGNRIMLRQHLIKFIMDYYKVCEAIAVAKIKDMEDYSLIKHVQLLDTNNHVLYLTKTSIGFAEGRPSKEVATVNLTEQKIKLSIYRTEYILCFPELKGMEPKLILEKSKNCNKTQFINKNKPDQIYKMFVDNFKKSYLNKDFKRDYYTAAAQSFINQNKLSNTKNNINKDILNTKKQRDLEFNKYKKENTKRDPLVEYYNFNNMLSKNFFIQSFAISEYNINVTLGYWDILTTGNTYNVYKDIGYIYNMLVRYFKIPRRDYLGKVNYVAPKVYMDVNFYCQDEKRVNVWRADSNSIVRDFYTGEKKPFNKAYNTIIKINKNDVITDRLTFNFLDLNVKRYFN